MDSMKDEVRGVNRALIALIFTVVDIVIISVSLLSWIRFKYL